MPLKVSRAALGRWRALSPVYDPRSPRDKRRTAIARGSAGIFMVSQKLTIVALTSGGGIKEAFGMYRHGEILTPSHRSVTTQALPVPTGPIIDIYPSFDRPQPKKPARRAARPARPLSPPLALAGTRHRGGDQRNHRPSRPDRRCGTELGTGLFRRRPPGCRRQPSSWRCSRHRRLRPRRALDFDSGRGREHRRSAAGTADDRALPTRRQRPDSRKPGRSSPAWRSSTPAPPIASPPKSSTRPRRVMTSRFGSAAVRRKSSTFSRSLERAHPAATRSGRPL